MMKRKRNKKSKKIKWIVFIPLFLVILSIAVFNRLKPLPRGLSYESKVYYTDEVAFFTDLTYEKVTGELTSEQEIFKEAFEMVEEAEEMVIVNMFLFNSYTDQDRDFPDISGKLTEALINQKERYPNLQVVFLTDRINTGYHSYEEKHLALLEAHGIEVVFADLNKLRDANKLYSAVWRLVFQPFGQGEKGWLPNPFAKEAPSFTMRSYLELFNVKANHRKLLVTEKNALITSANPHNESGFASNIAFKVSGEIIEDIVKAEQAVIDYSGGKTQIRIPGKLTPEMGDMAVQYLTEGKILKHILSEIKQTKKDDTIWLGMFYISDRDVIVALHEAAERGVKVQLILDPNKAAFGNQKIGLPNIPVASELTKNKTISIRWYNAEKDQYHTKMMYIKKQNESVLIGGSANFTTRNLDDINLENNLKIIANPDADIMQEVDRYFQRLWHNEDGIFTLDYEINENSLTPVLKLTYWVQKITGLTTY